MTAPRSSFSVLVVLLLSAVATAVGADDIPDDVVVDVRVLEARSTTPDFETMEGLAFFINTDGDGVSEDQWLSTIARQATDSFLATLAFETIMPESPAVELELAKRSRKLALSIDLSNFLVDGLFHADVHGELLRRDELQREFDQTIEMRLGQTMVFSGRGLELSPSEYLSHFRDYEDSDDRGELYDKLRDYTTFLIVALTPRRLDSPEPSDVVSLTVPDGADVPDFTSPLGIKLVGTLVIELDIDPNGSPADARVVRSSIPEVNSQILDAVRSWSFAEARGQRGRLTIEVEASP